MRIKRVFSLLLILFLLAGCNASVTDPAEIQEKPSDAVTVVNGKWSPLLGFDEEPPGLGIAVNIPNYDAVFTLTVNDGCFEDSKAGEYSRSVVLNNGESIGWVCYNIDKNGYPNGPYWDGLVTYVDITIEKHGVITGYAVVKIMRDEKYYNFTAEVVKCVTFEGQKVTKACLQEALANAKE